MKIEATITEAKTSSVNGTMIELKLEGWAATAPTGTTAEPIATISVPRTPATEESYHIGRKVLVTVEPK
jgi:hypothetical protein